LRRYLKHDVRTLISHLAKREGKRKKIDFHIRRNDLNRSIIDSILATLVKCTFSH